MAKPAFNNIEINKYLWSIKDNISDLEQWVTDLETDFVKAFTDRFDVSTKSQDALNNMDQVLKDQVIHGFKEGLDKRKNLNVSYYQPMVSGIPGGDIPTPKGINIKCTIHVGRNGWYVECTISFQIF